MILYQIIVPKESFQDLYLELKEKYQDLESRVLSEAKEGKEDVKRHVWKVGPICCCLLRFLWLIADHFDLYRTSRLPASSSSSGNRFILPFLLVTWAERFLIRGRRARLPRGEVVGVLLEVALSISVAAMGS